MKNIKYIMIIFLSMVLAGQLLASNNTIQGNVVDDQGKALAHVVVTNNGQALTITAANGEYNFSEDLEGLIKFSAIGYKSVELTPELLQDQDQVIMLSDEDDLKNIINLPFTTQESNRVVGSVNQIDVQAGLEKDIRTGLNAAINGKIPGMMGGLNTWGTGNAVVIVDGVPRSTDYLDMFEVESITVLKDASAKVLYGSLADQGIILVQTRRGKSGSDDLRLTAEYGVNTPRVLPNYLGAAEYMKAYNQGQLNDGVDPDNVRYSQTQIDGTIAGDNPTLYPDEDFYSETYVKPSTNYFKVFGDVIGGNQSTQYYANFGYKHNQGWINTGTNDATDVLNMRGNVDFLLTDHLKMSVDAIANFEFKTMPNVLSVNGNGYVTSDFWDKISSIVPNAYPISWDPNTVTDNTEREILLQNANLVNGLVLGGNTTYQDNLLGLLTQNGDRSEMSRMMQFNTGLDLDMSFLTEGLCAKVYGTMNFFNHSVRAQNGTFSVYEPVYSVDMEGNEVVSYIQHGNDESTSNYGTKKDQDYFSRQMSFYGTLNYNRSFNDHAVSAVGLAFLDNRKLAYDQDNSQHPDYYQDFVTYHYGISANYAYQNKYVIDASAVMLGSQKLNEGSRWGLTPTVGLAWILSEESFLNSSAVDFLKLRSTFGVVKNDNWDDYYLTSNTYSIGYNFNYNNTQAQNAEINYESVVNDISFQSRRELSVGFDALLFDNSVNVSGAFFYSEAFDQITEMSSTYPEIMGYTDLIYNNYNSTANRGFELGVEYNKLFGDLDFTVGSNMLLRKSIVTKKEEPRYADDAEHRYKEGRQNDGLWGYTADGLYGENDFDTEGQLLGSLPTPTFGAVQPGDIKYVDINGDNVIDADDQDIIGNSGSQFQYSAYINVKYKKFELYALGIGQIGHDKLRNGNYFWVYGDLKYSDVVLDAYGPTNKNVNASYPRLSSSKSNHNFKSSTFWMYENNWFNLSTVQLSYNFGNIGTSFINNAQLYVKANDVVVINKNKDKSDIKTGQSPAVNTVSFGFVTTF